MEVWNTPSLKNQFFLGENRPTMTLTLLRLPSSTSLLDLKSIPRKPSNLTLNSKFPPVSPKKGSIVIRCSSNRNSVPSSNSSLQAIKPYLQSEWKLILKGWAFGAISVFSLSRIIPKAGKLSSILCDVNAIKRDGMMLAALFSARLVANYLQQAFLWEASFNLACKIRAYVFERVLERDLGFFEGGGGGVTAGDIAHRITTEAVDVADTVFALLNVS